MAKSCMCSVCSEKCVTDCILCEVSFIRIFIRIILTIVLLYFVLFYLFIMCYRLYILRFKFYSYYLNHCPVRKSLDADLC